MSVTATGNKGEEQQKAADVEMQEEAKEKAEEEKAATPEDIKMQNHEVAVPLLEEIENLGTIEEENPDNGTAAKLEDYKMPQEEPYKFHGGKNVVGKYHRLCYYSETVVKY
jgi:hypothetical protein